MAQLKKAMLVFVLCLAMVGFLAPIMPAWAGGDDLRVTLSGWTGEVPIGEGRVYTAQGYGGNGQPYEYEFWVLTPDGNWVNKTGDYTAIKSLSIGFSQVGTHRIVVYVRNEGDTTTETNPWADLFVEAVTPLALTVNITSNLASPQPIETPVTFQANIAQSVPGDRIIYYQWWVTNPSGASRCEQDWSTSKTWVMESNFEKLNGPGNYTVKVYVRESIVDTWQATNSVNFTLTSNAYVTHLTSAPSSVTMNKDANQALEITADYNDGATKNVTSLASYQTSNSSVATCSSSGVITAVNNGSATITASCEGVSVNIPVTVQAVAGSVTSVTITPDKTHTYAGQSITFTASASGSSGNILYKFSADKFLRGNYVEKQGWSSNNKFTFSGEVANYGVKVEAKDASVDYTQAYAETNVSYLSDTPCTLSFSKPSPQPVNTAITLTATKPASASGNHVYSFWACPPGGTTNDWYQVKPYNSVATTTFTGAIPGMYQFEAYCKHIDDGGEGGTYRSGFVGYEFQSPQSPNPVLESIRVVPSTATITGKNTYYPGNPLKVEAKYVGNPNYEEVTDTITWSSTDSNKAKVEAGNNLKSGITLGSAAITASYTKNGVTKTATCAVTVAEPALESIRVVPASVIITGTNTYYEGNPLKVEAKYVGGNDYVAVTDTINWSVGNSNVAKMETGNKLKSVNKGNTTVTASYTKNSVTKTAICAVTVVDTPLVLESIRVVPSSVTISGKNTYYPGNPLKVEAKYANNPNYAEVTDTITWTPTSSNIAKVETGNNLKSGTVLGSVTMTASYTKNSVTKMATCGVTVTDDSDGGGDPPSGGGGTIPPPPDPVIIVPVSGSCPAYIAHSGIPVTYVKPCYTVSYSFGSLPSHGSSTVLKNTEPPAIQSRQTVKGFVTGASSINFPAVPATPSGESYVIYKGLNPTSKTITKNSETVNIGYNIQTVTRSYYWDVYKNSSSREVEDRCWDVCETPEEPEGGWGEDGPPEPYCWKECSYKTVYDYEYEYTFYALEEMKNNGQSCSWVSPNNKIDTRAPETPVLSSTPNQQWTNSGSVSVNLLSYDYVGTEGGAPSGVKRIKATSTGNQAIDTYVSGYSGSVAITKEGVARVKGQAEDGLSTHSSPNFSAWSSEHYVRIDRTKPNVPSFSSPPNQGWTNADSVTVTITANDIYPSGVSEISGTNRIEVTATGATNRSWTLTGSSGSIVISAEGVTNIVAKATDNANNVSAQSGIYKVKIDRTKPNVPSFSSPPNQGWTNADSITVTITALDINPGVNEISNTNRIEVTATGATSNNWTLTGSSGTILISAEGVTDIVARAIDNANNITAWSGTYKVRIDRTPPTVVGFFTKDKGASVTMPSPNPYGGDSTTPGYNAGKFAGCSGGFNISDINNRIFYRYPDNDDIVFKIKAIDPNTKYNTSAVSNQSGLRNLQVVLTKTDESGISPITKNSASGELTFTKADLARAVYNGGTGHYTMTVKAWDNPIHGTTRCNNSGGADCSGSSSPYNCTAFKFDFTVTNLDLIGLTSILTSPTQRTVNLKGGPTGNIKTPGYSSHPVTYPQNNLKLTEEHPNWAVYNNNDDKITTGIDIPPAGNGTIQLQYRVPLQGTVTLRGRTQTSSETVTSQSGGEATYTATIHAESLNPVQITVRPVSGLITNLTPYNASSPHESGKVYTVSFYTTSTPLDDGSGEPGSGIGVPVWGVPDD